MIKSMKIGYLRGVPVLEVPHKFKPLTIENQLVRGFLLPKNTLWVPNWVLKFTFFSYIV
jgi:hypothetical protein